MRQQYPKRGQAKTALLAVDDLAFGISRMFQTMSSMLPQEIMVFRTFAEAEKWLLENNSSHRRFCCIPPQVDQ